jgi:hypothetical protein
MAGVKRKAVERVMAGDKCPTKAIRLKCIDCCGYEESEVNKCHLESCPLWPFRFGKNPYHKRAATKVEK